jgi:hypothetical protein
VATVLSRELGQEFDRLIHANAVLAVHGAKLPYWRAPQIEGIPLLRARKVRRWITRLPALYDAAAVARMADIAEQHFPPYRPPAPPTIVGG